MTLLFINFNFGDIYGDSESLGWEVFKALLAAIPVLIGLWIQRNIDRNRQKKNKEDEIKTQNENLKLQLFNFNEHIKAVIASEEKLIPPFKDFSVNIQKAPFEEHLMTALINIPDLFRIDELNKDDLFKAFLLTYQKKLDGAKDFRKSFNAIAFYKTIYEFLYTKYNNLSNEIFLKKVSFRANILAIKEDLTEIVITNDIIQEPYKSLHSMLHHYGAIEKVEMEKENSSLQFYLDELMTPLADFLTSYEKDDECRQLYRKIVANFHLRDDIVNDSNQLGALIGNNLGAIPQSMTALKQVSGILDQTLAEYYI